MSSFGIKRLIGVPSVWPSKTPDRICTVSDSLRCETSALCPGARRSRSGWMSAADRRSRGGPPSTTAPVAPPSDSPQVVTRKSCPQVLPMRRGYDRISPTACFGGGEDTMSGPLRVVHYVNQFFGGIGGEDQAHVGVSARAGAVGPGRLLEKAL